MSEESPGRKLLSYASRLGYGRELLRIHDRLVPGRQIKEIDKDLVDDSIREFSLSPDDVEGKVLLPMTVGNQPANCYRYCILAHLFRINGYEPIIPVCYRDFSLCIEKQPDRTDNVVCETCNYRSRQFLEAFGLDSISISDLMNDPAQVETISRGENEVTYKNIRIGKYARGTLRKFLKRHTLDIEGEHKELFEQFLQSAATLVDACEVLYNDHDIDVVIGHDPNYIYSGIYLAAAEEHGIPAYSTAWGYSEGTTRFGRQTNQMATSVFSDEAVINEHMTDPLSEMEMKEIEDYMDDRMKGRNNRISYSSHDGGSFHLESEKFTAAMFTNLIWDNSVNFETKNSDIPGIFEWIDETIDFFQSTNNQHLLIKTHPAEAIRGTNESVSGYIEQHYELPQNITLIPPDADIDTYALFGHIDVGLVYNSTVGLEMAYSGVPVVVAGKTHYRGLGFTHDTTGIDDYLDCLENLSQLESPHQTKQRARRYAHLLFIRKHFDFPYVTFSETSDLQLQDVSSVDIRGDAQLRSIVTKSVSGEPLLKERSPVSRSINQ